MSRDDLNTRGLQRISTLSGYTVSDEDPDIRGWNVVGMDGEIIGKVDDLFVDTGKMKVREVDVDIRGGEHISVPAEQIQVDHGHHVVRIAGYGSESQRGHPASHASDRSQHDAEVSRGRDRLTRTEEELRVGKQQVQEGEVVVGKHVETERVQQPVTLRREEVVIERRPVPEGTPADEHTIGTDEVRVPLMREEAVVEKRPVVKEEIVIGKRVVEDRDTVQAEVRREEFDIDDPTSRTRADRKR
jgi:uncharacterized protein (TIGR02271 family)